MKKGMMSGCVALACSLALLFGCAPGGGDQAGETAPYTLDFLTDGSSTEGRYLSDPGQSTAAENAGRLVQKGSACTYVFPLEGGAQQITANARIKGAARVCASADGAGWEKIAGSSGGSEVDLVSLNLSGFAGRNLKQVYLRFEDSLKEDGEGFTLYSLTLKQMMEGESGAMTLDNRFALVPDGGETELTYLVDGRGSGVMDGEHRFADESAYWVYGFQFDQPLKAMLLDLKIRGQYGVQASADGTIWQPVAMAADSAGMTRLRISLTPLVLNSSTVYVRFEDTSPADGMGADLWDFGLEYTLENGAKEAIPQAAGAIERPKTEVSFDADGSEAERIFMLDDRSSGIMVDHRYADNNACWTYAFRYSGGLTGGRLSLDMGGQFTVKISADGRTWETIMTAQDNAGREWREADVSRFLSARTGTLLVRFEDSDVSDGFGPSLWSLRLQVIPAAGEENPSVSLLDGPVKNRLSFAALDGPVEKLYMAADNGSAIDRERGYRYGDMEANWIYGFSFYDLLVQAELQVTTGGEYRISVSADGQDWQDVGVSEGRPDLSRITLDLREWLARHSTQTLYVKFADRDPSNGFGVRLSQFDLSYALGGGQPDTAPAAID